MSQVLRATAGQRVANRRDAECKEGLQSDEMQIKLPVARHDRQAPEAVGREPNVLAGRASGSLSRSCCHNTGIRLRAASRTRSPGSGCTSDRSFAHRPARVGEPAACCQVRGDLPMRAAERPANAGMLETPDPNCRDWDSCCLFLTLPHDGVTLELVAQAHP